MPALYSLKHRFLLKRLRETHAERQMEPEGRIHTTFQEAFALLSGGSSLVVGPKPALDFTEPCVNCLCHSHKKRRKRLSAVCSASDSEKGETLRTSPTYAALCMSHAFSLTLDGAV